MNSRAKQLVEAIKALELEEDQFKFIHELSRGDQSELQRVMSPEFRARYNRYAERSATRSAEQIREEQLEQARRGRAENEADMVEVLLENRERLKPNDLKWIQDIDATAAGLVGITFTPRQKQVVRDIYLKYYAGAS